MFRKLVEARDPPLVAIGAPRPSRRYLVIYAVSRCPRFALRASSRSGLPTSTRSRRNGLRVEPLLDAGNNLDKAQRIFERTHKQRPRIRLTIRQRMRVLDEWPRHETFL